MISHQGQRPEEQRLLEQPVLRHVGPAGGTNQTRLVELADNTRADAKPFSGVNGRLAADFGHSSREQPLHEVAAWRLASFLEPPWATLVPPCVLRPIGGQLAAVGAERFDVPGGITRMVFGIVLEARAPDQDQSSRPRSSTP